MESKEIVKLAIEAMEEKKAEEIKLIDIADISSIGDYFLITNGSNINQVQTITDAVEEKLGRAGVQLKSMEGKKQGGWILLDYGDVIIHIFDRENRLFYDLERIWKDGKEIPVSGLDDK